MGGFTEIFLKDKSEGNIEKQNNKLELMGMRKDIRFYSIKDVELEYAAFLNGEGVFPSHLFPKEKINSFADFRKYWSPEALGSFFVPHIGSITFDCYYGRTSKRAMRIIGKYIVENIDNISHTTGSFTTFMERGMTKQEIKMLKKSGVLKKLLK